MNTDWEFARLSARSQRSILLDKLTEALNVPFRELFLPHESGAEPPGARTSGRPRGKS
jgi:hypothetical protein